MSDYEEVVKSIMSQISSTNVEAIFGQSRQVGERVIIPVGKISYGWGGGGGKGERKEEEAEGKQEGAGGGLGMGVAVKPIGTIVVEKDKVHYDPIVDYGPILTIASVVCGFALLKILKIVSRIATSKST
jgi:uncharacterized spore protein YtfJ